MKKYSFRTFDNARTVISKDEKARIQASLNFNIAIESIVNDVLPKIKNSNEKLFPIRFFYFRPFIPRLH